MKSAYDPELCARLEMEARDYAYRNQIPQILDVADQLEAARREVERLSRCRVHDAQHGDKLIAEARAESALMRPVVEAAEVWRDGHPGHGVDPRYDLAVDSPLVDAIDAYRARSKP